MGDPTEKITVPSGTTFYVNSVAKAIAMVGYYLVMVLITYIVSGLFQPPYPFDYAGLS